MNILVNHQNYRNVPKRAVILCSHKDLHILGIIQTYFIHTIFKWQFLTAISFPNIRYVYIRYSFHGQSLNPEPYL